MLTLHNLQSAKKSVRPKKRVGRGNASGQGTYSTRGLKGQRSRSGGKSGLTARSMRSYLLRIPKTRGFKSQHPKPSCVNVKDLQENFENGVTINARDLLKAKLISTTTNGIKILSLGTLSKKFVIEAEYFSTSAKEKIIKAGGQAVVVGKPAIKNVLKQAKNKQDA